MRNIMRKEGMENATDSLHCQNPKKRGSKKTTKQDARDLQEIASL